MKSCGASTKYHFVRSLIQVNLLHGIQPRGTFFSDKKERATSARLECRRIDGSEIPSIVHLNISIPYLKVQISFRILTLTLKTCQGCISSFYCCSAIITIRSWA